jgi:signal recognition particle receptor subunit beta
MEQRKRTSQERKQATPVMKLIVVGLPQSGKTSFIKSVSQYTEWQNQQDIENSWFFGRVRVDESLILHFMEPPMGAVFDFLWLRDMISKVRAGGYILLVDSTKPQQFGQFLSILYTIRGFHEDAPLVVAANKQDMPRAWNARDIQLGLGIRDITVHSCSTEDSDSVRDVVIDLLYQVMG